MLKEFIEETGLKYKKTGTDKTEYNEHVSDCYIDWLENKLSMTHDAVLGDVLAELMEEIEKENKEENIGRARITTIYGNEMRLDDLLYGYELRFKKVLGKYFV